MWWVLLNYPHSKNINLSLNNPDLYIQPSKDLTELKESKLKIETELEHHFEQWSNLED